MILPDVNVLVYAFRRDIPQHAVCRRWLADVVESDARFGLSPAVLSAVVRITTNLRAFKMPSAVDEAFGFCEDLLCQPHCQIVEPGDRPTLACFQATLRRNRRTRIARHRRLVRGACHRVGLRVDHVRPRLCAVSGIEVAGACRTGGGAGELILQRRGDVGASLCPCSGQIYLAAVGAR